MGNTLAKSHGLHFLKPLWLAKLLNYFLITPICFFLSLFLRGV
jgi:hypothetical protein